MMISFFFAISLSQNVTAIGDWPDTYLSDEAAAFVEQFIPEKYKELSEFLSNLKSSDREDVLFALGNDLDDRELGILNLSLQNRFFNPKAACKNPINGTKAKLGGWGINFKTNVNEETDLNNFHFKLLTALNKFPDAKDKIEFLKEVATKFPVYAPVIANLKEDEKIKNDFSSRKDVNPNSMYVLLNGKQISYDFVSINEAILQEFKLQKILKELNFTKNEQIHISSITHTQNVRRFTELPKNDNNQQLYSPSSKHKKDKKAEIDTSNLANFMLFNFDMLRVDFFVYLDDPESLPLMKIAFDMEKDAVLHSIYVWPIIRDLKNATEVQIFKAYYNLALYASRRNALQFIFSIMEGKDPVHTYEKLVPSKSWKEVKKLGAKSIECQRIVYVKSYAIYNGINRSIAAVNGEFILENPVFPIVREKVKEAELRLFDDARTGKITNDTKIDMHFYARDAIPGKAFPVIQLDDNDVFDFDEINNIDVAEAMKDIVDGEKYSNRTVSSTVAITVGYRPTKNINTTVLIRDDLSEKTREVFRVKSRQCTIISPFVFDRQLSDEEIEYVTKYVGIAYAQKIFPSSPLKVVFQLFLRGLDKLRSQGRYGADQETLICSDKSNPIQIIASLNPLLLESKALLSRLWRIAETNAAGVCLKIELPQEDGNFIRELDWSKFADADETGVVEADEPLLSFDYPINNWAVQQTNVYDFKVCNLYADGYANDGEGDAADIGGTPYYTMKNGFLPIHLPAGRYGDFCMDSFAIHKKYLKRMYVHEDAKDERINVITSVANQYFLSAKERGRNSLKSHMNVSIYTFAQSVVSPDFIPLVNVLPRGLRFSDPGAVWCYQKFCLAPLVLPAMNRHLLVTDVDVHWMTDISCLLNIDMQNASAVLSTHSKEIKERTNEINRRFGRPLLSGACIWYDTKIWNANNGSDWASLVVKCCGKAGLCPDYKRGEFVLSSLQLYVQVLVVEGQMGIDRVKCTYMEYLSAVSRIFALDYSKDPAVPYYL